MNFLSENDSEELSNARIEILELEFNDRKIKNQAYSLRGFAYDLGLEPSTLSQYFRRKRKFTAYSFNTIKDHLTLSDEVAFKIKKKHMEREIELKLLDNECLDLRSHWHSFAILELIKLDNFEPSRDWISKVIGLPIETIDSIIDSLIKSEALILQDGKWIDNLGNITFINGPNMDEDYGQTFQKSLLEKAKSSIEECSGEYKDHTSMTFAIDTSLIPELKDKIKSFRREIALFVENKSKKINEVYTIQINLNSMLTHRLKNAKPIN